MEQARAPLSSSIPAAWRYALYLLPPEPWYGLGTRWLGRCARTNTAISADQREAFACEAGIDLATLDRWTEAPRQYGLHATFKPPFRLATDRTVDELDAALRRFAQQQQAFAIEPALQTLRGFWLGGCVTAIPPATRSTSSPTRASASSTPSAHPHPPLNSRAAAAPACQMRRSAIFSAGVIRMCLIRSRSTSR